MITLSSPDSVLTRDSKNRHDGEDTRDDERLCGGNCHGEDGTNDLGEPDGESDDRRRKLHRDEQALRGCEANPDRYTGLIVWPRAPDSHDTYERISQDAVLTSNSHVELVLIHLTIDGPTAEPQSLRSIESLAAGFD